MLKVLDKIWCWHGWTIVKWPFGALLLWFILVQIYCLNTVDNYDRKFLVYPSEFAGAIGKNISGIKIELPKSSAIKNIY